MQQQAFDSKFPGAKKLHGSGGWLQQFQFVRQCGDYWYRELGRFDSMSISVSCGDFSIPGDRINTFGGIQPAVGHRFVNLDLAVL